MLLLYIEGGGIIVHALFFKYFVPSQWPLSIYSVVMAAAMGVDFWSGIKIWKREKRGILKNIRKMQEEFGDIR
jgi:hypothetical protein